MYFKRVKILSKELALNSSAIGIVKLIKSKSCLNRLFWLIYIILSGLICAWFMLQTFQNYFSYSVVTNIQKIYEQHAQFPAIVLCYDNVTSKDLKSLIKDCRFSYDKGCHTDPDNYFEHIVEGCVVFNSGKNMSGDKINFFYSTVGGYDDCFYLKLYAPDGFQLMIYNISNSPDLEFESTFSGDVFDVSPGASMLFIVEKTIESKLGEPYNSCFNDVSKFDLNKTIIDYFDLENLEYNQENCLRFCFELDYLEKNSCGCIAELGQTWYECYLNKNSPIKDCVYNAKMNFFKYSAKSKCTKYCPQLCDSTSYSVSSSTTILFDDSESNKYAEIRVYFRSLRFTVITQDPKMTISDLISNIGGTVSLFVGLSFVSLFEIIELIFELFLVNFNFNKINNS